MKKSKISKKIEADIVDKYSSGIEVTTLADQHKVCDQTIYNILRRHEVCTGRKQQSPRKTEALSSNEQPWASPFKFTDPQPIRSILPTSVQDAGILISILESSISGYLMHRDHQRSVPKAAAQRDKLIELQKDMHTLEQKIDDLMGIDSSLHNRECCAALVRLSKNLTSASSILEKAKSSLIIVTNRPKTVKMSLEPLAVVTRVCIHLSGVPAGKELDETFAWVWDSVQEQLSPDSDSTAMVKNINRQDILSHRFCQLQLFWLTGQGHKFGTDAVVDDSTYWYTYSFRDAWEIWQASHGAKNASWQQTPPPERRAAAAKFFEQEFTKAYPGSDLKPGKANRKSPS